MLSMPPREDQRLANVGSSLGDHGLPRDAIRTELEWFLFLDHGYIQSTELAPADWWTIDMLSADHAKWLAAFIEGQYPEQYPQLLAALRRGGRDACCRTCST